MLCRQIRNFKFTVDVEKFDDTLLEAIDEILENF